MNKRLIIFLLLLLAIPAATIISADEYVVNGNFEDGDKGWLMVPGSVVEDSVGFNGTGGLKVFRLSNDEPYLVNHQDVDVEPGTPYRSRPRASVPERPRSGLNIPTRMASGLAATTSPAPRGQANGARSQPAARCR